MKCRECGTYTVNKDEKTGEPTDICFDCNILLKVLYSALAGINNFESPRAKRKTRKLEILDYKITKI